MRGFWWLTQFSSKYSTVKCNKWIAVRYDLKQYTRLINWQVWSLQISLYDWSERTWTVQFLIPSRDITDPARKTWPLGSPPLTNSTLSLFYNPIPKQSADRLNILTYIEKFCIDKWTFSKYFDQPKSFKALTILNSWNVRSRQWSKWVNWNITDVGFFPFYPLCNSSQDLGHCMSKVISLCAGLFQKWATQTNKWRVGLKQPFPHLCFFKQAHYGWWHNAMQNVYHSELYSWDL